MAIVRMHGLFLALAAAVYGADQLSKWAVITFVPLHTSWPDAGFARITHIANSGSAFGLFGGRNSLLTLAAVVGIAVIVFVYRSQHSPGPLVRASLALMLAGALGNLTDRLLHGHVTDFVDIGPWYIFNVADASIVTGVVSLVLAPMFAPRSPAPVPSPAADGSMATDGSTAAPEPLATVAPPPATAAGGGTPEGHDDRRP